MSHNRIDVIGGEITLGQQEYVEFVFAPCMAVHSIPCTHHFIARTNWAFVMRYLLRNINWNELGSPLPGLSSHPHPYLPS